MVRYSDLTAVQRDMMSELAEIFHDELSLTESCRVAIGFLSDHVAYEDNEGNLRINLMSISDYSARSMGTYMVAKDTEAEMLFAAGLEAIAPLVREYDSVITVHGNDDAILDEMPAEERAVLEDSTVIAVPVHLPNGNLYGAIIAYNTGASLFPALVNAALAVGSAFGDQVDRCTRVHNRCNKPFVSYDEEFDDELDEDTYDCESDWYEDDTD